MKGSRPGSRLWGRFPLLAAALLTLWTQAAACDLTAGWHALTAPYVTPDSSGEIDGDDIRLLRLAASEIGCVVSFVHRPWRRLMQELRQGAIAIGVDVDAAAANEADAVASDAYRDRRLRIWVREEDFSALRSLAFEEAIKRPTIKIGLPLGYSARPFLRGEIEAAIEAGKAEVAGDAAAVLQKMLLGRLDIVFADETDATRALAARNLRDSVRMLPLAVEPAGATYALSRRGIEPTLRKRLNDAIGRMILDGLAVSPPIKP